MVSLKAGVMTPVRFVRMARGGQAKVAFENQRGIASLPSHIKPADLRPGTPLDVRITAVNPGDPSCSFRAEAKNIIGPNTLALMYEMYKLFGSPAVPRSQITEELSSAIGKTRVTGNILSWSRFARSNEPYLSVTVGYKSFRAHGEVSISFEEVLEQLGRNSKIKMEVLDVEADPGAPDDFSAIVFVPWDRQTYAFDVGREINDFNSSKDIINRALAIFPMLKPEQIRFSDNDKRLANIISGYKLKHGVPLIPPSLCRDHSAEDIFGAIYYTFVSMGESAEEDGLLMLKELMNAIADIDLSMIHKIGDIVRADPGKTAPKKRAKKADAPSSKRGAKPAGRPAKKKIDSAAAPQNAVSTERIITDIVSRITSPAGKRSASADVILNAEGPAANIVNMAHNKEFDAAAKYLLKNFGAKMIAEILLSACFTMKQLSLPDRNEKIFEILDCISKLNREILFRMNDLLKEEK